ncbi:hypothetical protein C8R43DRAFT_964332 [Mycena crocata]|nr:hypothetical protein C8R43DRAFT_964332 [Mycena crocata]
MFYGAAGARAMKIALKNANVSPTTFQSSLGVCEKEAEEVESRGEDGAERTEFPKADHSRPYNVKKKTAPFRTVGSGNRTSKPEWGDGFGEKEGSNQIYTRPPHESPACSRLRAEIGVQMDVGLICTWKELLGLEAHVANIGITCAPDENISIALAACKRNRCTEKPHYEYLNRCQIGGTVGGTHCYRLEKQDRVWRASKSEKGNAGDDDRDDASTGVPAIRKQRIEGDAAAEQRASEGRSKEYKVESRKDTTDCRHAPDVRRPFAEGSLTFWRCPDSQVQIQPWRL